MSARPRRNKAIAPYELGAFHLWPGPSQISLRSLRATIIFIIRLTSFPVWIICPFIRPHSRASAVVTDAGRGAVAAQAGCKDEHPQRGGPSREVPMRQPRIKGAHRRQRRTAGSTARCCTRLRNGGKALRPDKGTKPERSVNRGSRGASLQTPRAERRGTSASWQIQCLCTHDLLRTQGHGAFGAPAFRAPSDFFQGRGC